LRELRAQCRSGCAHASFTAPSLALIDHLLHGTAARIADDPSEWRSAEVFTLHNMLDIMSF
jgi:hypothetical protein